MSILAYLPTQAELDAETEREAPPVPMDWDPLEIITEGVPIAGHGLE